MAKININQDIFYEFEKVKKLCPFNVIEMDGKQLSINSGCKMCMLCVKNGPKGLFEFVEEVKSIDKSEWRGIMVYVEHFEGVIHPVTYELIGKAKLMAQKVEQKVYALFIGKDIVADELLEYNIDEVFVYDKEELFDFKIEPYTNVFEDCINKIKPSIILVGGTVIGRSLAPRIAARFRTGLTADCTKLDIKQNTDLDQIRPAFGGNIMAHIHTPNHRPQFSTVRYKIFSKPKKVKPFGKITICDINKKKLTSDIEILNIRKKSKIQAIEDAEVIIVAGRGLKKDSDIDMVYQLAEKLNAQVAGTRPLIESGLIDPRRQIGLSGRTVSPKLLITIGVSGSVQFVAGMRNSECIIAINKDEKAPIMGVAHYAVIGDLYNIVPNLIEKINLNMAVV